MLRKALLLIYLLLSTTIHAQSIIGAWESYSTSGNGDQIRNVVIFADGYQVATWYNAKTGAFIMTNGGLWSLNGDTLTETVEFDTNNAERVGTSLSFKIKVTESTIEAPEYNVTWKRIDNGTPGDLKGAWLMSGRKRNGEIQQRDTSRPRKTMKILSGTRFQWIAYNTETKQFSGTGGGTYTTIDGKYTENIEFFSRDNLRVGASLEFNFELINNKWHHSGFSSKGDPLYEIWSLRN